MHRFPLPGTPHGHNLLSNPKKHGNPPLLALLLNQFQAPQEITICKFTTNKFTTNKLTTLSPSSSSVNLVAPLVVSDLL